MARPPGVRATSVRPIASSGACGWPAEQVAEVLLIDPNTVRTHFRRYRQGGLRSLLMENFAITGR